VTPERKVQPGSGRRVLGCLAALFLLWPLRAEELARGRILDRIVCLDDFEQSYALYLPSSYRPDRAWPVIYCFDPGGRGSTPVALFKAGADRYGCLLIGSNNSRNGPWDVILRAMRAVWLDSHARLAIDDDGIYAAGFSGGARAACGLGKILSVRLRGVIACGAGLPEWLAPADMAGVPWFGTVGLQDFNYDEMRQLEGELRSQGSPCRLQPFAGGHSWPPPELALEAVAWLLAGPAAQGE
jgi:hypothetical protein